MTSSHNNRLKITILVDNIAPPGFAQEHGLAMWIETPEGRILLDAGQGQALDVNAQKLGVDLHTADAVILSHGHYDHANGLPLILKSAARCPVYAHPDTLRPRYSLGGAGAPRFVGISSEVRDLLAAQADRIVWNREATRIFEHVHLTGQIPRKTDFEDTGGAFHEDEHGLIPDKLLDDQALWVETSKGLVVLLGCAHSGVINTLHAVINLSGRKDILAVIGGLHLLNADARRLDSTVAALKELSPSFLAPCHCTGTQAAQMLEQHFKNRMHPCHAGSCFYFEW